MRAIFSSVSRSPDLDTYKSSNQRSESSAPFGKERVSCTAGSNARASATDLWGAGVGGRAGVQVGAGAEPGVEEVCIATQYSKTKHHITVKDVRVQCCDVKAVYC
jgi:hypothetical protein